MDIDFLVKGVLNRHMHKKQNISWWRKPEKVHRRRIRKPPIVKKNYGKCIIRCIMGGLEQTRDGVWQIHKSCWPLCSFDLMPWIPNFNWQLHACRLPQEKLCCGRLHRSLLRLYRPQSAVSCSTLWERAAWSSPNTSQVSLLNIARRHARTRWCWLFSSCPEGLRQQGALLNLPG